MVSENKISFYDIKNGQWIFEIFLPADELFSESSWDKFWCDDAVCNVVTE